MLVREKRCGGVGVGRLGERFGVSRCDWACLTHTSTHCACDLCNAVMSVHFNQSLMCLDYPNCIVAGTRPKRSDNQEFG